MCRMLFYCLSIFGIFQIFENLWSRPSLHVKKDIEEAHTKVNTIFENYSNSLKSGLANMERVNIKNKKYIIYDNEVFSTAHCMRRSIPSKPFFYSKAF